MNKGFLDGYKTYDTSGGFGSPLQWTDAFEFRMNYKRLSSAEKKENKGIVQPLYDATSPAELKAAYHSLMLIHHPDKAGDTEQNKTIAQHINDTYFKLKTNHHV